MEKQTKIVIINQAVNYLTIGISNEFNKKFDRVDLMTGSIHVQGEALDSTIRVTKIRKWQEDHGVKKFLIYILASIQIYWLLITKYRRFEVFFISAPPMGYLLNLFLWHKFSVLVWDVYPDVFKITGMNERHIIYRIWAFLNKKSFNKAFKLFTIGHKMTDLLAQYVDKNKIIVTPIWSIFQENTKIEKKHNKFIKTHNLESKFVVQYSGNIGLTHNVEVLIDIAKEMEIYKHIIFQIIGRGPRKDVLEKKVLDENISNCHFLPFQSDDMFPFSLAAADLGVVLLNDLTSKGSVPSKSYNLMSYGIPSLYIASKDSELNEYAKKFKHAACFEKKDMTDIIDFIVMLSKEKII